jgi:hypothetical protein
MQTAGARPLREDEPQVSRTGGLSLVEPEDREAVLLQWERKIEQEERRSRFAREEDERADGDEATADGDEATDEPDPVEAGRRFARPTPLPVPASLGEGAPSPPPVAERRTITISGRPDPLPRRRQSVAVRTIAAQPDRLALWAFLLGLFLLAVAFGTAHA